MAKNAQKDVQKVGSTCCSGCSACKWCSWLFPIVILLLTLVPDWYGTNWAKWVLVVVAVLLLAKKWCPCKKSK
tara:strand:+ start:318 stop:536 length:219 start_codon:yes stop_codon:yes gene_type:complete